MRLFRPVGLKELELIAQSGFTRFPPRLAEQPIFYPVLNFEYAQQIAAEWNTKSNSFAGFVLAFEVDKPYVEQFEIHIVGNRTHQELGVPAEELDAFNQHIIGKIEVMASYFGSAYTGEIDALTNLPVSITKFPRSSA